MDTKLLPLSFKLYSNSQIQKIIQKVHLPVLIQLPFINTNFSDSKNPN